MPTNTATNSNSVNSTEQAAASTARRVADKAHSVIDDTVDKAESVEQQVRQHAAEASEKVGESQKAMSEKLQSQYGELKSFVQKKPVAAAGIAFAAGIIVSSILRR